MKKYALLISCVAVLFLLGGLSPTTALCDQVKFTGVPYGGTDGGGELRFEFPSDPSSPIDGAGYPKSGEAFTTFCLEKLETLEVNNIYDVAYSRAAKLGGDGNQGTTGTPSVGLTGTPGEKDPISRGTAELYSMFTTGTISSFVNANTAATSFDYYDNRDASADWLQAAIWWLEDEIDLDDPADDNLFLAALNNFNNLGTLSDWQFDYDPFTDAPGVYVMNLTSSDGNHQDVLVAPVPEPATLSLWALGLAGCAGVGAYRRRRRV